MEKFKATILFSKFLNNTIKEKENINIDEINKYIDTFNKINDSTININDFIIKHSENPMDVFLKKNKKYYSRLLSYAKSIKDRSDYIMNLYSAAEKQIKKEEERGDILTLADLIEIEKMSWEDIETYLETRK